MVQLYDKLDVALSLFRQFFGAVARVAVDAWDGQSPREKVGARTISVESQLIGAGATIGPFGWLDLSYCAHPSITIEMLTTSYDPRDLSFYVEYAEMVAGSVYPRYRHRDSNAGPCEYTPNNAVYVMELERQRGVYARIKAITNNGAGDVTITAWSESLVRPLPEIATVYDNIIEEE